MEMRVERARRNAIGTASAHIRFLVVDHHQSVCRSGQSEGLAPPHQRGGCHVVG